MMGESSLYSSLLILSMITVATSLEAASEPASLSSTPPNQQRFVKTSMCTTKCEADGGDGDCVEYTTPLNECFNGQKLFPGDESWSGVDMHDEMAMRSMKRTFYDTTDGSCGGIAGEEAVDDQFILPFGDCVGPFGPPRPWGSFTLVDGEGHPVLLEGGYLDEEA